jgi:predicted nucleic acid-binding protein
MRPFSQPYRRSEYPEDDMVLGCAVAAGADYLVTRDKDLLSLVEYAGIKIVTPEVFRAVLRQIDIAPSEC